MKGVGPLLLAAIAASCTAPRADVLVFAAASLKTALDEIAPVCEASTGVTTRTSYAASSTLARQIEEGAHAGVFVLADLDWMDYLAARGLIDAATRVDLVGNRLALIAPASRPVALKTGPQFPLADALQGGRLALADPAVVPAGKYAKAALTTLGVWEAVADRVAPADHVRAALLLVSRAEAPLGIVYRTDAIVDPNVVVVDLFDPATHPPIVYPAAVTSRGSEAARQLLGCLRGEDARRIFDRHGFTAPAAASPPGR